VMGGYSIEDPWTSSSSPSRQESSATSSRPLTWAAGNSDRTSSTIQYQESDALEEGGAGVRLPEIYEKTWDLCRSADHGNEVDISLSQLGKVVRCAQSIGAADVERVSTVVLNAVRSYSDREKHSLRPKIDHKSGMRIFIITLQQARICPGSSPDSTGPVRATNQHTARKSGPLFRH
jgi:hypothetical protein